MKERKFNSNTNNTTNCAILPITPNDILERRNNYYIFLTALRWCTTSYNVSFLNTPCVFFRVAAANRVVACQNSGLTRQSFNPVFNRLFAATEGTLELTYQTGYIAALDVEVWDQFVSWLKVNCAPREFNGYTRLMCWLYHGIMSNTFRGFFQSVEILSRLLMMSTKDLSARLAKLEAGGWIKRGNYNSMVGLARTYALGKKFLDKAAKI